MAIYIGLALLLLYIVFLQRVVSVLGGAEPYRQKSKWLLLIAFCLLLVLAAFRGQTVGTDSAMYARFFYARTYEEFELAVHGLYAFAQYVGLYELVPFMLAALFLAGMLRGIYKHCPNDAIGLLLFVLTFVYLTSFNQMRQLVAAALIFCCIGLLLKKGFRKLQFAVVIVIASLFHQSALFLFVLFVVPRRRFHPLLIAVFFAFATVCYFTPAVKETVGVVISTVSSFYEEKYAEQATFFQVNKQKGVLEFLPIAVQMGIVLAACYYPRQGEPFFQLVTNVYVLSLLLYAWSGIEAIDRVQVYFSLFAIYFYSMFIHSLLQAPNQLLGKFTVGFVLLFWGGYYVVRLLGNHQGIVPYIW